MRQSAPTSSADDPSPWLRRALTRFGLRPHRFLEIACGYGRNTAHLLAFGASGVVVDVDERCLTALAVSCAAELRADRLVLHRLDEQVFLDACSEEYDLVCCTDYWRAGLVTDLARRVRDVGWVVMHTPSARGGNYLALPAGAEFMREVVASRLEVMECQLTFAGRAGTDQVTAKLVARKANTVRAL